MKTCKKILGHLGAFAATLVLTLGVVRAVGIINPFINEPALAYSKRLTINLDAAAVNTVSATAVYSSATIGSASFSTGQISTGSFKILSNAALSTGTATNAITVLSTAGAVGDSIVVTYLAKPGAYVFRAGRDWNYKATPALTAASLRLALLKVPDFNTIASGAVLYSTATNFGANYNAIAVQTNNPATLAISSPTFLGGRSATIVYVNGSAFRAGVQFTIGATAALSATNLAQAINDHRSLGDQLLAATATSSVTVQSTSPGALYNFPLASSNEAAIVPLHATMVGGATPAWTLNSKNLTLAAHGFSLALPVLYSSGTALPISGLIDQTTYYAIPIDANTIQLATTSARAVAGLGVVLASSSTLAAAKTSTLAPLPFTNAQLTGGKWQVSNDASSWTDMAVSSFSWQGGGGAGSTNWDLGKITYKYLSFNVVGPATGGLNLYITAQGSYSP